MRNFLIFSTLLIAMTLAACGASVPAIKPYKIEIQQGNVVTSEMLLKLRPGMTKSQVQFIMGTPLLVDSFHTNRWDYFYQLRKQGEIVSQRRVILDFEKDLLVRVRGDVVPKGTSAEDVAKQLETEADKNDQSEAPIGEADKPAEPIVKPIEEPDIKPTDAAPESSINDQESTDDSENAESNAPASVLVVPVGAQPAGSSDLVPKVDLQAEEVSPVIDRSESSIPPSKQTSSPAIVPLSDAEKSKAVDESKKPASINNESDEKLIFRLDRQLDDSRINQQKAAPLKPLVQDSVVKEIKEGKEDAPLNQEEPSVFERILEKIGF